MIRFVISAARRLPWVPTAVLFPRPQLVLLLSCTPPCYHMHRDSTKKKGANLLPLTQKRITHPRNLVLFFFLLYLEGVKCQSTSGAANAERSGRFKKLSLEFTLKSWPFPLISSLRESASAGSRTVTKMLQRNRYQGEVKLLSV